MERGHDPDIVRPVEASFPSLGIANVESAVGDVPDVFDPHAGSQIPKGSASMNGKGQPAKTGQRLKETSPEGGQGCCFTLTVMISQCAFEVRKEHQRFRGPKPVCDHRPLSADIRHGFIPCEMFQGRYER
jgi:hypothetical protein